MRDAHDTFEKAPFVWKRFVSGLNRWNEDEGDQFASINLTGLFDYNYFRKWPTVYTQPAGEMDRQTVVLLMNRDYLRELGYMNANDRFDYDPGKDRFLFQGIVYKSVGDTMLSQSGDRALLFDILLKREDLQTGEEPYNANFP